MRIGNRKSESYQSVTIVFGIIFARLLNRFFVDYINRGKNIDELKSSNEQMNSLLLQNKVYLQLASDGVHVLDPKGNILVCSQSFAKTLGYTYEEALTLNVRDWEAKIDEDGNDDEGDSGDEGGGDEGTLVVVMEVVVMKVVVVMEEEV